MAVDQRDIRVDGRPGVSPGYRDEPPLGELFRQLTDDASRLIRQEVALGKAELRETASALGKDLTKIGIAVGLALLGAMAATAFVIVALGSLLANYWLSALIVAVVMLAIGGMMAKNAINDMKSRDLKPTQTIDTLREDARWAKREAEVVKREWQS